VVSIAESLNYRIFERKWRPGEAFHGHPRACRIAQCRTKTQTLKRVLACVRVAWFSQNLRRMRGRVVTPNPPSNRRFMGNAVLTPFFFFASRRKDVKVSTSERTVKPFDHFVVQKQPSFVTDLSAAGSPAELKHITQRRKRKQP
jgi:hypothetical protein